MAIRKVNLEERRDSLEYDNRGAPSSWIRGAWVGGVHGITFLPVQGLWPQNFAHSQLSILRGTNFFSK